PLNFSAGSFFSATLNNLPAGRYRAAIVSNAVPSVEQLIDVETTPLLGTYPATVTLNASGSTTVSPTSLPAGYNGTLYPLTVSVSAGFTGTPLKITSNGAVSIANASPIGDHTITIAPANGCGSPSQPLTAKTTQL